MPDTDYPSPATTPEGAPHPEMDSTLSGICTWAVISLLDYHPNRGPLSPTLVYKIATNNEYQVEIDPREYATLDEVFVQAREKLADIRSRWDVEAYALVFDSLLEVPGLPEHRGVDAGGTPYPQETPTLFVCAGELGHPETIDIAQCFSLRRIRGGAETLGAPVVMAGGDSLF